MQIISILIKHFSMYFSIQSKFNLNFYKFFFFFFKENRGIFRRMTKKWLNNNKIVA